MFIMPQSTSTSPRHLFAFTRWQHGGTLACAVVATIITGALKTVLAIVFGKIFEVITKYGSGQTDGATTSSNVTTWCLVLVGLGLGTWAANTAFLAFWMVFGELQAKSIRDAVFASLLHKDMAWFDSQRDGVTSLLVRAET